MINQDILMMFIFSPLIGLFLFLIFKIFSIFRF